MDIPAKPLIYVQNETAKATGGRVNLKDFFKKHFAKIIFIVLAIIIAVEAVIAVQTLFLNPAAKPPKIYSMGDGRMILTSDKTSYDIGEKIFVSVKISTGGKSTTGSDLVLKYDQSILETTDSNIKVGSIYQEYPVAAVDNNGEIIISGYSPSANAGFSGVGEFAVIEFKSKKAGSANLDIDFQKDETNDSNIVAIGDKNEILGEVRNLELTIGSSSSQSKNLKASCEGYIQYCQNSEGKTGRQFCQKGKVSDGQCSFDPELTVSCDACRVSE